MIVVYDACVLYPAPIRDFLIRVAAAGLVQAKWTEQILDEVFFNLLENHPQIQSGAYTILLRVSGKFEVNIPS
ncbi:MAG: hypothetical protein ACREN8_06950 [Candidatus Dormibacteraceae bacterium]